MSEDSWLTCCSSVLKRLFCSSSCSALIESPTHIVALLHLLPIPKTVGRR
jgi:hypothetical protein